MPTRRDPPPPWKFNLRRRRADTCLQGTRRASCCQNHNVKGVVDPTEALRLYDEFEPDLVLLDLHMPKLDGFAVMKLLEDRISSDAFLPVLVLTADVQPEVKPRALAAGAKDFVNKPFDRTEVLLRIQNLLQTRFLHLRMRQDQVPDGMAT
jgi:putative two-component system response regulator